MTTYLVSILIKPSTMSKTQELEGIIAFQEEDHYYLAGVQQMAEALESILPEIDSKDLHSIKMRLEIREGDQIDADSYDDFLENIRNKV